MKRVLLITVGTGKTGKDIAVGIHFSIHRNPHDIICFIVTELTKEKTLPHILELLKNSKDDSEVDVVEVDEVNDVEILIEEYQRIIDGYIKKGISPINISVDYTSGTKAMSVALVYSAITREVDTISYIYGRRDDTGTVIGGTYRINPLKPNAIFTSKRISRFKAFFNKYQFESALEILDEGQIHFEYADKVQLLKELALGYAAWDKFDFETASEKLNSVSEEALGLIQLKGTVRKHKQLLYKLKQPKVNADKAKDLYFNAIRRFEEGKYDDGVARLYRTIEMVAQIEFSSVYGCSTGEVTVDVLSIKLQQEFKHVFNEEDQVYRLGLMNTFKALLDKKSELAIQFFDNEEEFKKVLGARNNSILAHGSIPIQKNTFEKFRTIIDLIFPIDTTFRFPKLQ